MNLKLLFKLSTLSAIAYLVLVIIIPVATLSVMGLIYLSANNLLLTILFAWLVITTVGYLAFVVWPSKQFAKLAKSHPQDEEQATDKNVSLPQQLTPQSNWTTQDIDIWTTLCQTIENLLDEKPAWESLPDLSLLLLSDVSSQYNGSVSSNISADPTIKYRFTIPEALLVLSVGSHRYRELVLAHIPFSESITVSSMLSLYGRQTHIKTGYTWLNRARRILRVSNPLAAAVGELKDQFTDRVFSHLSNNIQNDLKRLLLQEVVQVGIDLYSGKLKSTPSELIGYRSDTLKQDEQRTPDAVEPLRIVLMGQSSAGKSSLINALSDSLQAEVDILPTTSNIQTHALDLGPAVKVHLIDTIGLGPLSDQQDTLVKLAVQSDLIVFVARSTQPARNADSQLYQTVSNAFEMKPTRRPPPILLVLTHVDQLKPRNNWSPPYDLGSDNPKAKTIIMALKSCLAQIGLPAETPAVPVCLSEIKGYYNVEAVSTQLMLLQDTATLAQWNRRRIEQGDQGVSWDERWSQIKGLGQVIGRAAIK
jgi:predicted GTPase